MISDYHKISICMTTSKDTEGVLFECRSIFNNSNTVFYRAVPEFTPLSNEWQIETVMLSVPYTWHTSVLPDLAVVPA